MTNEEKYKLINLFERGVTAREASTVMDISYVKVIRFKNEFDEAKLQNTIDKLIPMDKVQLEQALEQVPVQQTKDLVQGIHGLDRLDTELQHTAGIINDRVRNMIMNVDSAGELSVLTNIVCDLRNAFFNKNQTQVNIQNNYTDEPKYQEFLSDVPAK